jgi:hypothetical protein
MTTAHAMRLIPLSSAIRALRANLSLESIPIDGMTHPRDLSVRLDYSLLAFEIQSKLRLCHMLEDMCRFPKDLRNAGYTLSLKVTLLQRRDMTCSILMDHHHDPMSLFPLVVGFSSDFGVLRRVIW